MEIKLLAMGKMHRAYHEYNAIQQDWLKLEETYPFSALEDVSLFRY